MTPATGRPRQGFALASAIGGLVVIGVLIAGVFFTANQEFRVGANSLVQEQAFRAAEYGLNSVVTNWDNAGMTAVPVGSSLKFSYSSGSELWWDTVNVTRLNATVYQLVSAATARGPLGGEARRRTAMTVRLSALKVDAPGALTVRQKTTIGGSALISGVDENPSSWLDCPPVTATVGAVSTPDKKDVGFNGCPKYSCLIGSPQLDQSSKAGDTLTYFNYGDETWQSLTSVATKVFDGNVTLNGLGPSLNMDGTCNKSAPGNWGSPVRTTPAHACEGYFPIIWAKGATARMVLNGGVGQGILLVEGDLELSGGITFHGPIVVRGRVSTSGGATVMGAVMAANLAGTASENDFQGAAVIKYSQCAISGAAKTALAPKRVRQRAWTELF